MRIFGGFVAGVTIWVDISSYCPCKVVVVVVVVVLVVDSSVEVVVVVVT